MKEEKLYPVYYNGKEYYEKDCDDVFVSFYHTRLGLNAESGTYLAEDIWVYPDGSMGEW